MLGETSIPGPRTQRIASCKCLSCGFELSVITNRRPDNVHFEILVDRMGETPGCDLEK